MKTLDYVPENPTEQNILDEVEGVVDECEHIISFLKHLLSDEPRNPKFTPEQCKRFWDAIINVRMQLFCMAENPYGEE